MNSKPFGYLLVVLQFGILAMLVGMSLGRADHRFWWASGLLWVAGLACGLWAISVNRPGNFNIHPQPKTNGRLVEKGPYRWVRHPMYTSVLLLALGCAVDVSSAAAGVLWGVLVGVLTVKSSVEEVMMVALHPEYAGYRARTKRFVPYVL